MFTMTAPKRSGRCDSINVAVRIAIAARACRWMVGAIIATTSATAHAGDSCVLQWSDQFTGGGIGNGWVEAAIEFDDDGPGPNAPGLYLTGGFSATDGLAANHIAKWNGIGFSPVGTGMDQTGRALAVFDPDQGGPQTAALIVGGDFDQAGGLAASHIASWDGRTWSTLGVGTNGWVTSLAVFDEDGDGPLRPVLFAGGLFTMAGDVDAGFIARWNGMSWSAVGGGVNAEVSALFVWDPDDAGPMPAVLVAGGDFTLAGGKAAARVAQWDGGSWSPLGVGMSDHVTVLGSYDADGAGPAAAALIAGGSFSFADGHPANGIAEWNGDNWVSLGSGLESWSPFVDLSVYTLAVFDIDRDGQDELLVGGDFIAAGDTQAVAIAAWDGAAWSVVLPADIAPFDVEELVVSSIGGQGRPVLYGAGSFLAGDDHAGAWDGTEFQPLGGGIADDIRAIAAVSELQSDGSSQVLYVGGKPIPEIDGAEHIARWDGSEWSALGDGLNNSVYALLAVDHDSDPRTADMVYAGGTFDFAGVGVDNVAKWDGQSWSALGIGGTSGFGTHVGALATYDVDGSGPGASLIIAAGSLTEIGEVPASNIASWNGSSWSALGGGVDGVVRALAVFDEDGDGPAAAALFAGGEFMNAGGQPAAHIARWDGAAWSAVGGGMDATVRALYVFDDDGSGPNSPSLFAGGDFIHAGLTAAGGIARWNGSAWSAVGTIYVAGVRCLHSADLDGTGDDPARLIAGGTFVGASGGGGLDYVAMWDGQEWGSIGGGTNFFVNALAAVKDSSADTSRQSLFAGGMFGSAGGISSRRIARWGCDPGASSSCPADQNEDGVVNGFDLAQLLGSWGPCLIPTGCEADLDDNGVVNGVDLALLLGAWGPC